MATKPIFRKDADGETLPPPDNWQRTTDPPDYIPPDQEKFWPGRGFGAAPAPDFFPDAAYLAKKARQSITPEQEKYGLDYVPGSPPPKKRRIKPFLNPNTGEREG